MILACLVLRIYDNCFHRERKRRGESEYSVRIWWECYIEYYCHFADVTVEVWRG